MAETTFLLTKIKESCFDPYTNASCVYELDGKVLTRQEIQEAIDTKKTKPMSSCTSGFPSTQEQRDVIRTQCVAEIAYLVDNWNSYKTWVLSYKTLYHRQLSFESRAERFLSAAIYMGETHVKASCVHSYPPCEDTVTFFQ